MIDSIDFLRLQGLCKYTYNVSISRSQARWRPKDLRALVRRNVVRGLFMPDNRGLWIRMPECGLTSSRIASTIVFRHSLIAFYKDDPMLAVRFNCLSDPAHVKRTEIAQLDEDGIYDMFATCVVKEKFVLVTGGKLDYNTEATAIVNLLDVTAKKWYKLPNLEQGRSYHSSCATDDAAYVFGGMSSTGQRLDSLEMFKFDNWLGP